MPDGRDSSKSGVLVYPRLPIPKRSSDPKLSPDKPGAGLDKRVIALFAGAVIAGGAVGWFLRPAIAPDGRIGAAEQRAKDAEQAIATEKERASGLDKLLANATAAKQEAETKLRIAETAQQQLAGKSADGEKQKKDAEAVANKVRAAFDKSAGSISIERDEVHVLISTAALFRANDDGLTDHGKAVLSKLAGAFKELPDRAIWVQGHTDDTPVPLPTAPKQPPPKKGAKPPPPAAAPPIRFATNWELSGARALAVVHHFQDVSKVDPGRLVALAFGQYAPISKKDKALNRRIEIAIVPRKSLK